MAEKKEEESKVEAKGGGKKKLIIIIVVVLILVGGGVGAFFALGKSGAEEGEEGAVEGEEHGEGEEGAEGEDGHAEAPPAVLPLDTFIVNLQVKGSFLKTTIQLEFVEPELPPTIEHETPKIRDAIIRLLSSKSSADILSAEGKEKLREELRQEINSALKSEDVGGVYFTEFIIQ